MKSLHLRLIPVAPYLGVVAALLALTSWWVSSYFGAQANAAKDSLKEVQSVFSNASKFRRIYSLVNEETQNLDSLYDLLRELSRRIEPEKGTLKQDRYEQARYDHLKRLEYTRHGDRVIQDELDRAEQVVHYAVLLQAGNNVIPQAKVAYQELFKIHEQRRESRKKVRASIAASGDVYKLADLEWNLLIEEFEAYRQKVDVELIPLQNEVSKKVEALESEILTFQAQVTDERQHVASIIERLVFLLYLTSGFLALYGIRVRTALIPAQCHDPMTGSQVPVEASPTPVVKLPISTKKPKSRKR